ELATVRANEITASLRPNPTALYSAEQFGGGSAALPQHTVILAQPIETGGKRQRRIDSARAATRTTGHELNDVRRLVIAQVKSAFAGVLVARATLALAEQNLGTLDDIERLQRIRADNTIGFGFSFPLKIFDRNQGEIARTRAEAERSDALTRSAAVQALAEVDTALSALTVQRERVVMLRDTYLPKAQQARTTV